MNSALPQFESEEEDPSRSLLQLVADPSLSDQDEIIEQYIRGKVVHDLGCGSCLKAERLLELGAKKVVAIDRYPAPAWLSEATHPNLEYRQCLFEHFRDPVDVAFVAWPINWRTGLEFIVLGARIVIYMGCNTDSTMCGEELFWRALRPREVLAHLPHYRETLIAYGPEFVRRPELPEEFAAFNLDTMWSFEDACKNCDIVPDKRVCPSLWYDLGRQL